MKKRILSVLLFVFSLTLVLSGCSHNTPYQDNIDIADSSDSVNLTDNTDASDNTEASVDITPLIEYVEGSGYQHGYIKDSAYISPFLGLKASLPDGWSFSTSTLNELDYADNLKITLMEDGMVTDLFCGAGDSSSFAQVIPAEYYKIQIYDDLEGFYAHKDNTAKRTNAQLFQNDIDGKQCDVISFVDDEDVAGNTRFCRQIFFEVDKYGAVIVLRGESDERLSELADTSFEWLE